MPKINAERLLADLRELRTIGAAPDHPLGVIRPTYSNADMRARQWLVAKLEEAGFEATIDGIGNVLGRSRAPVHTQQREDHGTAVLVGSHTDTQPSGGWLDGAMGVVYGLEAARALSEDPQTSALPVDVVSFADEEGTYYGMVGSRSFCGELDPARVASAVGNQGVTGGESLPQALRRAGLEGRPRLCLNSGDLRNRYAAFLEAHIEQGPFLELEHKRIGVVTGIVGIRGAVLEFKGEENHAGTTPMHLRKDAGMAAVRFGAALNQAFRHAATERSVWTFGEMKFEPGSHSIVPGRATLCVQWRDQDTATLDRMETELHRHIDAANADGSGVHVRVAGAASAHENSARCADALQEVLAASAEKHAPGDWMRMPSGAAHDAQVVARHMPAGMLFVPSIKGISHNFEENTTDEDIVLGCRVFADAVAETARRANARTFIGSGGMSKL